MRHRGWIGGNSRSVVGVLDIGTTKIACLICASDTGPELTSERYAPMMRVLGVGHQRSQGVKGGVVTDLDQAEQAARSAIAQAERMAGVMLDEVHVSVACGRLKSLNFEASAPVEGGVITDEVLQRLLAGGKAYAERDGRMLVHLNEVAVRLDGAPGAFDPRGLAASRISADLHAVTADEAPLRNLVLAVERCHVGVASVIPAPYASALAAATEEERRLGVTCIDIGGGTSTVAMFADGRFIHAAAIPMGGHHITLDIARALHTPLAEAERIKALYGTLVGAQSDEHDVFSYPVTGGGEGAVNHMTKAELAEVIRPRVWAIVAGVRELLESCDVASFADRCVVLTGGTSQLVGIAEYVANELVKPVRVARPHAASGLPPAVSSPAFSTAAGLALAGMSEEVAHIAWKKSDPVPQGYLARVGTWLKEGF